MIGKEIKKEIRKLRKLKLQCRPGSQERISLHRQIKALQVQKEQCQEQNIEKESIIAEILRLDKYMAKIDIDLTKHSKEDLQKYLTKIKGAKHGRN
jgi:septal ring factor EnvC (AmiA/AmiB activator)